MVLTAGFYCDSRAHHVWKLRVVEYILVFSQIKAADQKFATTKNGDENSKKFGDNLDDFWPRHCREGLGFKPCSRNVFISRINSKFFKSGKEEYAFSVDK